MNIYIIGLGGIGSVLSSQICRFIEHSEHKATVYLVDGDEYEAKNRERQDFMNLGMKAAVKADELCINFRSIKFEVLAEYITPENIKKVLKTPHIILMCVDNHKTRKLVSDYCCKLKTVMLISGGNDYTDGNVQIFYRKGGKNVTPPLTDYHPEIATPDDKSPHEMSCEELSKSEPQLLFTNFTVAAFMLQAFYNFVEKKACPKSEVYFDMLSVQMIGHDRKPLT